MTVRISPNQKYGLLTVIRETGKRRCGQKVWECVCECGTHCEVLSHNLTSGNTKSCGCLRRERRIVRDVEAEMRAEYDI